MEGKFSTKYFLVGKGKETWFKTLGIGWRLVFIGILLFFVWRGITAKQTVIHNIFEEGSKPNLSQGETKKRAWWIPTPFVESYGFVETDDRSGFGMKGGCRWEF
jgi:hypothetical protein